jgi:hypothetical protein
MPFSALAQTADQTIDYINSKIRDKEADSLHIFRVKLEGDVFLFDYSIETDGGGLGRWTSYYEKAIELSKAKDFTPQMLSSTMRDDRTTFSFECDTSHGRCVRVFGFNCENQTASAQCRREQIEDAAYLPISLSPLAHLEEERRVKTALLHLKELFPLKKNVEMFDQSAPAQKK